MEIMKNINRTKRLVSAILTAALAFTAATPSFASDTDIMQKVLLSVKSRIGITDEFNSFESNVRETKTKSFYNFYWGDHKDGSNKNMSVTASENGLILDYYYYNGESNYSEKPTLNKISTDEAAERTKNLINSLNPEISDKIAVVTKGVTQNLYSNGFSFPLQRYENGIKVLNNDGYVRVNADATEIISFNLSYDEDVVFPSPNTVINENDAQKMYGEKIGMALEYKADYDYKTKKRTVTPVYIPSESNKYINAITGDAEEFSNDISIMNDKAMASAGNSSKEEYAAADSRKMSEAEKSEFENMEGLKTKDELIEIAKNNPYTAVADDMILNWYNTSKSYYEELYTATLSFERTDGEYKYTNITLNMETGEILSFYKNEEIDVKQNAKAKKLSEEQTKAIKEKAIYDLAGKKVQEYKFDEKSKNYVRYVNGIPYRQDCIDADVSELTGEIRSYHISYSNIEFPAVDNVISENEALSNLFLQVDYNLCYAKMNNNDTDAKLIYMLEENMPLIIDAFSGKLLNYSNEDYKTDIFEGYTDISGHYAENIINTLAKFGIRFDGKECKPNEAINQKDYIALLVSAFKSRKPIILSSNKDYDNEYFTARRENIIMPEEENPDEIITRELAVKYMIRAMELEEIASIPDIYICPFNDVVNLKGHIAILNGLKIINGDGIGNFNPYNTLTRADAMIMIYNYLSE